MSQSSLFASGELAAPQAVIIGLSSRVHRFPLRSPTPKSGTNAREPLLKLFFSIFIVSKIVCLHCLENVDT